MLTTSWEFYVLGTCRWRDQKANNLMKRDTIINVSLKQIFLCIVWLFLIATLIPICHLRISNLKIRILLHACHNLCFISVLRIGWCINFCGQILGSGSGTRSTTPVRPHVREVFSSVRNFCSAGLKVTLGLTVSLRAQTVLLRSPTVWFWAQSFTPNHHLFNPGLHGLTIPHNTIQFY